jgi:uncharacterized protein (TIGR02145 family)
LPQPITANAGANITDACVPVTLNGNTPSNGTGEWTINSGSGGSFDDSTSASASFSGNPGVTYTLEWAIGTQCDTTTDQVEVSFMSAPTTADAGIDTTGACTPLTLYANTPSNGTGEWTVVSGSGGSFDDSTSASASFSGNPGVTYTLEWAIGTQCDTTTDQVEVTFKDEVAAGFSANEITVQTGNLVEFTDQSNGDPTTWNWDFGDGNNSSQQNPSHTYSSEGTYTVELTVSNDCGEDTETKTDYITVESNITACDWNNDTTFTDSRDGQEYKQTKIGDQCWMAENLNYDAGGDSWCYDNNSSNCDTYGRLYDWAAVMQGASSSSSNPSGVQGVCPDGWHVPSDEEWTELENYVSNDGHYGSVGTALKSTSGWDDNGNGTDDYGFSGLPGGGCINTGNFGYIGDNGYWWSATEGITNYAELRILNYDYVYFFRNNYFKEYGFSVRCLRD